MPSMKLHHAMVVTFAVLMLNVLCYGQSVSRHAEEPSTPPIEFSQITFEFAVSNASGQLVWKTPKPGLPNTIPAVAEKLRFTARVNNRPAGTSIQIRAVLQELCPSPDSGKKFLARLRHLTESASNDEVQVIDAAGKVTIEINVHCHDCLEAVCGKRCPGKDHLGEGPHLVTVTASDPPPNVPEPSRPSTPLAAKPASFRVDIKSVCP
jgi:hypothetical protein